MDVRELCLAVRGDAGGYMTTVLLRHGTKLIMLNFTTLLLGLVSLEMIP